MEEEGKISQTHQKLCLKNGEDDTHENDQNNRSNC